MGDFPDKTRTGRSVGGRKNALGYMGPRDRTHYPKTHIGLNEVYPRGTVVKALRDMCDPFNDDIKAGTILEVTGCSEEQNLGVRLQCKNLLDGSEWVISHKDVKVIDPKNIQPSGSRYKILLQSKKTGGYE